MRLLHLHAVAKLIASIPARHPMDTLDRIPKTQTQKSWDNTARQTAHEAPVERWKTRQSAPHMAMSRGISSSALGSCHGVIPAHLIVSASGATKPLPSSPRLAGSRFTAAWARGCLELGFLPPWGAMGGGWDGTCPPGGRLVGGGRLGGGSMGSASSSESPRTTMVCMGPSIGINLMT